MVESFVERRKDISLGLRKVRCGALDVERKAARANRQIDEQGNIWLRWETENEKSKGFEIRRCVMEFVLCLVLAIHLAQISKYF